MNPSDTRGKTSETCKPFVNTFSQNDNDGYFPTGYINLSYSEKKLLIFLDRDRSGRFRILTSMLEPHSNTHFCKFVIQILNILIMSNICFSACLSLCLSFRLSVSLSACLSIFLPICPFISPCFPLYLSLYLLGRLP